jgi:hypothetical protein
VWLRRLLLVAHISDADLIKLCEVRLLGGQRRRATFRMTTHRAVP